MDSWQLSANIIIVLYRPFASGKFLSNVLSFNDIFCPQICLDEGIKRWHSSVRCLDQAQTFDHAFLQQRKIQEIFDTIPPALDFWPEWREYELGCNMFWGCWGNFFDPQQVRPAAVNILDHGYRCFTMCHHLDDLDKLRTFFPNAQVIQIINDEKILAKNLALKCSADGSGKEDQPVLPANDAFVQFDIDTVFDESIFFDAVDVLLQKLGIADRTLDPRVYTYYRKYTEFY